MEIPQGYALSAGVSTIFLNSSVAHDTQADWIDADPDYAMRFRDGDGLYDDTRTISGGSARSMQDIPAEAAIAMPGVRNRSYGTAEAASAKGERLLRLLFHVGVHQPQERRIFQNYGRVLHDQAIYGVKPEGKLSVKWHYEKGAFPDGEPYELCYPEYSISEWYADSIAPEDLFCTVRIPLRHVGMGPMMAIDRHEIEQLAAKSNYPEYGISGRANYITEKGKLQLGLSGNKAQHADLTVELGFSSDLGVTNSRYPEEICEGQLQMQDGSMMGLTYDQ